MSVILQFSAAPQSGPTWPLIFGAAEVQAPLSIAIDLGSPIVTVTALMDAVTVSGYCASTWQEASPIAPPAARLPWSRRSPAARAATAPWGRASAAVKRATAPWTQSQPMQRLIAESWRAGVGVVTFTRAPWQQAAVLQPRRSETGWRQGVFVDGGFALPWAGGALRTRTISTLTQAPRFFPHVTVTPWSDGGRRHHYSREPWRDGARQVSYGIPWPLDVTPPAPEVCYTPSTLLVFSEAPGTPALLFRCNAHDNPPGDGTIVVPIRRTYMILNNVDLRRVTGDIALPALSMSLSLDRESWTYGFNASLPADALPYLQPETDGSPALLEVTINGATFLVLAEGISRDRQFGQRSISVRGRGKNALLDAPYAPVMQFVNPDPRNVSQLMQDVLTVNGVSLGWDVDFGIDDWLVPGGTWSAQGSYIAALTDIATAAGAYLQPHPTDDTLRLLPLYPSAPWDWGTISPDFVLPAALIAQEGVEWLSKPSYTNVAVAGTTSSGILGNVTRDGTDGGLVAPMVTHSLIVHADAARQRGRAVLSDTGKQARVALRMPVLSEVGIIMPGKFVSYVDGATTRFGIARAVDVQVAAANVWQTVTLETHS